MHRLLGSLAVLLLAASAVAGELYGTITEGGKSVGQGVAVEVKCGDKAYPEATTDKSGSYHVTVQETGKCNLAVLYKDQAPSLEVASYDEGVQVDLVIEMKDGKYTLRRK